MPIQWEKGERKRSVISKEIRRQIGDNKFGEIFRTAYHERDATLKFGTLLIHCHEDFIEVQTLILINDEIP